MYQEIRDHLADELGVDPGPRLRHAHELARLTDMLATRSGVPPDRRTAL